MTTKTKVLATAPSADDVKTAYTSARDTLINKLGVSVGQLSDTDLKKLGEQVEKTGKNCDFSASFDGDWLTFFAQVGPTKTTISEVNVKALGDETKVFGILKKLNAFGLASAPVDPQVTAQKRKTLTDLENNILSSKGVKESYAKYTWETDDPAMYGALENWAEKHSQKHYLDFVGEITAKVKPQTIFDKYVKKGAKYPVNLNATTAAAIDKDLKAGRVPNLEPAKKEVTAVIKNAIVPKFKAEGLKAVDQGIATLKVQVKKLQDELKTVGAK